MCHAGDTPAENTETQKESVCIFHLSIPFILQQDIYPFFLPLCSSTLTSSPMPKAPPAHHLGHQHVTGVAAIGLSCSMSVTSVHTSPQRHLHTHTHWQTRDCPLLPLWTIISEVPAAGPEHSSLRTTEISHLSREVAACGLPLYVFGF